MTKVLLFELNEVNWPVVEPLLARGEMPNLRRLMDVGAWGTTVCRDERLDPCVAWPTLHTGTGHDVHNIDFLGQHPDTFGARQVWDFAIEDGKSVGVFGSLLSWPPRPGAAFYVPECFARDDATEPASAQPVQSFNIKYSTENKKAVVAKTSLADLARFGLGLFRNGLKPRTALAVAREVLEEQARPHLKWRRACLQPVINYDVFANLYERKRPSLATFFTNHVAYYLHRYWRAYFPHQFSEVPAAEIRDHADAIPYSLRVADRLLGQLVELADDDTVVLVASALGQGPVEKPTSSTEQNVLRSMHRFVEEFGIGDRVRVSGSMTHEHVLVCADGYASSELTAMLERVRTSTGAPIFRFNIREDTVCVTFAGAYLDLADGILLSGRSQPMAPAALGIQRYKVQPKTGDHTPDGIFVASGPGVRSGVELGEFDVRDVAPTMLWLLGTNQPSQMKGTPIRNAFA